MSDVEIYNGSWAWFGEQEHTPETLEYGVSSFKETDLFTQTHFHIKRYIQ